jgi:hypothetical protein
MKSLAKKSFRSRLEALPSDIRARAHRTFRQWLRDPHHPAIHFKKVGQYWSARVGSDYRALAIVRDDVVEWFWIGRHDEYERLIGERSTN